MPSLKKNKNKTLKPPAKNARTELIYKKRYYLLFVILLITFFTFAGVLYHDFLYNWDDGLQITDNPDIKTLSFKGIYKIFTSYYVGMYKPLVYLTYLIDYNLFGLSTLWFHFVNLLFHLIAVVTGYIFLTKIFQNKLLIFLILILFSVHPANVESVAWLSARSNILYTIFYLSGLIFYLEYVKAPRKYWRYLLVIMFFILSCLSKSAAVTFPVILLLIDAFYDKITVRKIVAKLPFFLISVVFGLIAVDARTENVDAHDLYMNYNYFEILLVIIYSVFMYFKIALFPFNNYPYYIYPQKTEHGLPVDFYVAITAFLILIIIAIYYLYKHKKLSLFGLLFFIISLSVMLKIVNFGGFQFVTDRYIYLPFFGILIALGYFTEPLLNKYKKTVVTVFCLLAAGFIFRTAYYNTFWKNEETLFSYTVNMQPDAVPCKNLLGVALRKKGKPDEAKKIFDEIILKYPGYGDAYNNRANIYKDIGREMDAFNDYKKALLCNISNVQKTRIYTNIGILCAKQNNLPDAFEYFNKAIEKDNKFYLAYFNRGKAYAIAGDFEKALSDLNNAVKINPDFGMAYYTRAMVYYSLGRFEEACNDLNLAAKSGVEAGKEQIEKICGN